MDEISQVHRRAEAGDPEAQHLVAGWYNGGICLAQDVPKAIEWYSRAAGQGDKSAPHILGDIYRTGRQGAPKDIDEAVKWYQMAAEQGDYHASRMLGDIYFQNKYAPQDLDEAEKWYRLAGEQGDTYSVSRLDDVLKVKDPIAWERKEQERNEKKAEQRRKEARPYARKAIARFGLISVSVIEDEDSKRFRAEVRKKLESLPESPKQSEQVTGGDLVEGTVYMAPYFGPYAPIAMLFLVIGYQVDQSIKEWKSVSFEDKAKIKTAIAALTESFAQADPEQDLTKALLATATRQQAPSLLGIDSGGVASDAPYQLVVQLEQLQIVQSPNSRRYGHLWAATVVELTSRKGTNTAVEKRICYMSSAFSLVAVAENPAVEIRKQLDGAYRSLSSQILSEVLGLAPDPDVPSPSEETEKWCESASVSIKVAGGYYTGEMKDGKRHGYGEMRYKKGEWVSIYRGKFVNDKEHGDGRCRWRSGGWSMCTFVNGNRL